jgi:hypothetical protein
VGALGLCDAGLGRRLACFVVIRLLSSGCPS